MTIYMVRGYHYNHGDISFIFLYGIFFTKERAQEIVKDLESRHNDSIDEEIVIEMVELDKPTDVYYAMTN